MKQFLLLNNNLYILLKAEFKKKEIKEKGKRKERKTTKPNKSREQCQACQYNKLYHAVNIRGKILNGIIELASLYSKL